VNDAHEAVDLEPDAVRRRERLGRYDRRGGVVIVASTSSSPGGTLTAAGSARYGRSRTVIVTSSVRSQAFSMTSWVGYVLP
jgi:hypothetical protein